MKLRILILCLITFVAGVQAEVKYHDFTDTQGRTIRGRILAYDEASGKVRFERDNRKQTKVSIGIFSEADQTYIKEWLFARSFMTEGTFKINAKRKQKNKEKEDSYLRSRTVEDTHYEIILENRAATDLNNLEVEYCIYYEQEEVKHNAALEEVLNQGVYFGNSSIESIASRGKVTLKTDAVSIFKDTMDSGVILITLDGKSADSDNVQEGEIHGIWIRVHLKLPSGERVTREYLMPNSINKSRKWTESSRRAGLN